MDIISRADRLLPEDTKALLRQAGELAAASGVKIYLVGGMVRDLVMNRLNLDIDLVVDGDGPAYAGLLAEKGGGSVVMHDRFGTSVVILPGKNRVDVATARTETYEKGGALPTVEFSSIEADLSRRDFSINAMAVSLNAADYGALLDFFGGLADIEKKRIRVLHNESFVDDPTRVFRAVRFERRFGFKMTGETERLLKDAVAAGLLKTVSGARIRNEIIAVFSERDPVSAVKRLEEYGVWNGLSPGVAAGPETLKVMAEIMKAEDTLKPNLSPHYKRSYAFLQTLLREASPEAAVAFCCLINVNRAQTKEAVEAASWICGTAAALAGKNIPLSRVWQELEHRPDETLVHLYAASPAAVRARIAEYLAVRKTKPLITGRDLVDMGYKPSAKFAPVLREILLAQLDGKVTDRAAEKEMAARLMGAS